jgi:glycosyltransferase involved in cell wall biosynthesis
VIARPNRRPRVAIDISGIDNQEVGSGQLRYATDLVNGVATTARSFDLIVLGSRPDPIPAIADVVRDKHAQYRFLLPRSGRGFFYIDNLRYGAWITREQIALFHQLHLYLPAVKASKVIVTAFDILPALDEPLAATRPFRYFTWALRHRTDLVLAISNATRDDVHRAYGVPLDRMRTVHLGLSSTMLLADPATDTRECIVVSPYNLLERKNLPALVEAWPTIAQAVPDARLILYGRAHITDEREAHFEALLRATPFSNRIVRTGVLTDEAMVGLLRRCAVFVFPTLREGFGYPLLEAMSQGACCVAANASAMAEVAGDGACLIDVRRASPIAQATVDLLMNPGRRRQLRELAVKRARVFSLDRMIRGTLDAYSSLLPAAAAA